MSIPFALLLGLIQGLTEFLPVSSSGHLAVFQNFFGMSDTGTDYLLFDVCLHLATLIAIFLFYRKDFAGMFADFFALFDRDKRGGALKGSNLRLLLMIAAATLPLFLFVLISDKIEVLGGRSVVVGAALLCTAALLLLADTHKPRGVKDERSMTWLDALIVGFAQGIATIPGLSRSGTTISVGVMRGFDRKFAVRFSFLMSVPAVLGAAVLELKDALPAFDAAQLPAYLAGMCAAGVVGYFSLCLLRIVVRKSFKGFIIYCASVGVIVIAAALILGR